MTDMLSQLNSLPPKQNIKYFKILFIVVGIFIVGFFILMKNQEWFGFLISPKTQKINEIDNITKPSNNEPTQTPTPSPVFHNAMSETEILNNIFSNLGSVLSEDQITDLSKEYPETLKNFRLFSVSNGNNYDLFGGVQIQNGQKAMKIFKYSNDIEDISSNIEGKFKQDQLEIFYDQNSDTFLLVGGYDELYGYDGKSFIDLRSLIPDKFKRTEINRRHVFAGNGGFLFSFYLDGKPYFIDIQNQTIKKISDEQGELFFAKRENNKWHIVMHIDHSHDREFLISDDGSAEKVRDDYENYLSPKAYGLDTMSYRGNGTYRLTECGILSKCLGKNIGVKDDIIYYVKENDYYPLNIFFKNISVKKLAGWSELTEKRIWHALVSNKSILFLIHYDTSDYLYVILGPGGIRPFPYDILAPNPDLDSQPYSLGRGEKWIFDKSLLFREDRTPVLFQVGKKQQTIKENSLVRIWGTSDIFVIKNNKKQKILNPEVFIDHDFYRWQIIDLLSSKLLTQYSLGNVLPFRDGAIIQNRKSGINYLIVNEKKRLISPEMEIGFTNGFVLESKLLLDSEVNSIIEDQPIKIQNKGIGSCTPDLTVRTNDNLLYDFEGNSENPVFINEICVHDGIFIQVSHNIQNDKVIIWVGDLTPSEMSQFSIIKRHDINLKEKGTCSIDQWNNDIVTYSCISNIGQEIGQFIIPKE